ncbi:hypothetical protein LCGC14_0654080 [marine sediment metagenome]|uniref:Cas10/Cmr2 second palm domain-containing protein n=1 Tax=marine sediment metagenome TaxID=412755 RepID=A0A0F9TH81_9ZZZZ
MSVDKILAVYDVTGIQNFIFSTNRLKENLGGSIAVKKASEDMLEEAITSKFKNTTLKEIDNEKINWNEYEAVIVYLGGGNAMVIFKDKNKAKEITMELSKKVLELSGGLLSFNVAYQKINLDNFSQDYNKIFKKLVSKKNNFIKTNPLLGIGITKSELSSGLPVQFGKNNEFLSLPTKRKRENYNSSHFDYLLEGIHDYIFPLKLENLGQKTGENYISIVHIDGDNIGKTIHDFLNESIDDYDFSLYRMSKFSSCFNKMYIDAFKEVIKDLVKSLENPEFKKNFDLKPTNSEVKYLPIRPIILKGDDITFITNGKLGVNLAALFLKKLSESKLEIPRKNIPHSASAGVAIVKTTFPFDKAYTIGEELCKSAKKKGEIIQIKDGLTNRGFWLDFHIIQSGFTSVLSETRKTQYNIQGLVFPHELETSDKQMSYKQSSLLWRPWCITGDSNLSSKYLFSNLRSLIQGFVSAEDKWPKSKVKKLQQFLTASKDKVEHFLLRMESRKIILPPFQKITQIFHQKETMTPYYDALELLDFYLPQMEEILK